MGKGLDRSGGGFASHVNRLKLHSWAKMESPRLSAGECCGGIILATVWKTDLLEARPGKGLPFMSGCRNLVWIESPELCGSWEWKEVTDG